MVYASASRALAYLETVVYLAKVPLPLNRYLVEVRVPRDLWEVATAVDAPRFIGWDAEPAGKASFDWGTAWARGTSTLLALVPSVIVVEESNVLINPAHPDAKRLRAAKLRRWLYDGRLVT
jgi:RES domain-containing protein